MTTVKSYSYKRAGKTIKVKGYRRGGAGTANTSKHGRRSATNPAGVKWPIDKGIKWPI